MPKEKDPNQALRQNLIDLLNGGNAHAKFDDIIKNLPPKLRSAKPENFPHSPWMLLEHLRIAQEDILDFCRNPKYKARKWPDDYWPKNPAPPSDAAWTKSVDQFHADAKAITKLISDPKTDLFAPIAWGDGQTILREALLVADHNAYHLGQLLDVRRLLGAWKD
jgi:hypothetical protein